MNFRRISDAITFHRITVTLTVLTVIIALGVVTGQQLRINGLKTKISAGLFTADSGEALEGPVKPIYLLRVIHLPKTVIKIPATKFVGLGGKVTIIPEATSTLPEVNHFLFGRDDGHILFSTTSGGLP